MEQMSFSNGPYDLVQCDLFLNIWRKYFACLKPNGPLFIASILDALAGVIGIQILLSNFETEKTHSGIQYYNIRNYSRSCLWALGIFIHPSIAVAV